MTEPPLDPTTGRYRTTGRPTLLTPALADRIAEVVRAGNYLKTAAQFVGVGNSTLQSWLARGRAAAATIDSGADLPESERPFLNFLEAVTQAETVAEVAAVTHWRRSFGEDWRAARDYLSRKRPEQWAAKTTVQISNDEADARIERATLQALTDLGVDVSGMELAATADGEPPEPGEDPWEF